MKNGTVLTIAGGGTVNVSGTGISGSSPNSDLVVDGTTMNLNVASTYNGPTFIRSNGTPGNGILNANVANALPTASGRTAVTMDDSGAGSSVLALSASQSVASLTSPASSSSVNLNSKALTVGAASGTTTFAGTLSGTGGSVVKDGASTQVLSGSNTFTGGTTISGGTLSAAAAGALGATSGVAVNSGGTLLLGGAGAIDRVNDAAGLTLNGGALSTAGISSSSETMGSLTLSANSTIDFGTGAGDQLTFAGVGAHTAGTTLSILNWSGTAKTVGGSGNDRLIFNGTSSAFTSVFAPADVSFSGFGPGYSAIQFDGSHYEIVAVPEPTTVFGGLILMGLAGWRERRRRAPRVG